MSGSLHTAAEAASLSAFFATVAFIVLYSALAPWWRTSAGWNIMALDAALALALLPSTLHYLLGVTTASSIPFSWLVVVAVAAVAVIVIWRSWMLLRLQFGPDKEDMHGERR